jgi:hypothetical protein
MTLTIAILAAGGARLGCGKMIWNILLASWLSLAASGVAVACPVCDASTGQQVRAGIFDGNFASTLVAVLVPFPIVLTCVAMIHFGWPSWRIVNRRGRR